VGDMMRAPGHHNARKPCHQRLPPGDIITQIFQEIHNLSPYSHQRLPPGDIITQIFQEIHNLSPYYENGKKSVAEYNLPMFIIILIFILSHLPGVTRGRSPIFVRFFIQSERFLTLRYKHTHREDLPIHRGIPDMVPISRKACNVRFRLLAFAG